MSAPSDPWAPQLYDDKHSFVWKLAESLVALLSPQADERILDLGCGTGQLTSQIAAAGSTVIGLDNSQAMIAEARRQHPQLQFDLGDAHDFDYADAFDAVFSNATLHWIREPDRAVGCIARALKPGGRLVAEFGGKGNVTALTAALESASATILGSAVGHPWYFPSVAEFGTLLETAHLEVTQAFLFDRPTPLEGEGGLRNWVTMFGNDWLDQVPGEEHTRFLAEVENAARPHLFSGGHWHADYRRLRVVAEKRR